MTTVFSEVMVGYFVLFSSWKAMFQGPSDWDNDTMVHYNMELRSVSGKDQVEWLPAIVENWNYPERSLQFCVPKTQQVGSPGKPLSTAHTALSELER